MAIQGNLLIEELYQKIEMEMLQNIGKAIGNGEGIDKDDVTQWRVSKLSQLGVLRDEQIKVLAKYAGLTQSEMKKFIHDNGLAEIEAFDKRTQALIDAGVEYQVPTNAIYERLLELQKQSKEVLNMINTNMITSSEQIYVDILTKGAADVLTGNATLSESVAKVAAEWAEKGIPVLTDIAGKKWSVEAYTNMVIRSTQKNVAVSMQEGRADDYDADLIEVSSHAGSRPSHIDYQGRIYSRSGKSKKYPALSETTYGDIDGIVTGINCSHTFYLYFEGISVKRYESYNKKESVEEYKESQKQRRLERNIRKAKKEKAMLESMDTSQEELDKAMEKILMRQAKMREFIEDTGRTRRRSREQVVS